MKGRLNCYRIVTRISRINSGIEMKEVKLQEIRIVRIFLTCKKALFRIIVLNKMKGS